jgi:hypothetical protein
MIGVIDDEAGGSRGDKRQSSASPSAVGIEDPQRSRRLARRVLLKAAIYAAPAVLSMITVRSAHAQPTPSCGPATCGPGPCNPIVGCNPPGQG